MASDKQKKWNPRYVLYAKKQGHSPRKMLRIDKRQLWRFVTWIDKCWRLWKEEFWAKKTPDPYWGIVCDLPSKEEHAHFDRWLEKNLTQLEEPLH